jgi:diguanylate cyclase (GGDEF)-like protein
LHIPGFRPLAWSRRFIRQNHWLVMQVGTVLLSLLLLSLAWLMLGQRIVVEKQQALASATSDQQNLATLMAENLRHVLDRGQLMAQYAADGLQGNPASLGRRLTDFQAPDQIFLGHAIHDARLQGIVSSASFQDTPELLATVRAMLEPGQAGRPQRLLPPVASTDERAWQIPLLTALPQGRGIMSVTLDLGYFLRFYRDINLGRSGVILVLDDGGRVLVEARTEGLVLRPTRSMIALPPAEEAEGQVLEHALFGDGQTYLSAIRRPAGQPFAIVIGRELQDILGSHPRTQARFVWLMGLFSALLLAITAWMVLSLRRQQRDAAELVRVAQEKTDLIHQLEEEKHRAFVLAAHDHLTGLPNRRMFNELLATHLQQAKRNRVHYALLFLDLDRFKSVNDNLGHHVGDLLLQEVAQRLRRSLRDSDVVARLGGDEFAILLTTLGRIEDCAPLADKLVTALSEPCRNLDGHTVQVSPSIGIAVYPRDGVDGKTLFRNADAAMYRSKELGRGKYTFYDPALNSVGSRLFDLAQRLPRAIADDELVLHFQPKVRLSDYRLTGFEALVRWQHPELGLIYPGEFIPAAEDTGQIGAIGAWVAEQCCRQLRRWIDQGLAPVPIAYNVSARQLHNPDLPAQLAARLGQHGIDPGLIEIEITETSLVESMEQARDILGALERMGIQIALDDFGSGFSGLDYVRNFPIHKIKIDRSFISDIRDRHDDVVIVSAIITMANNLDIGVVAEGVETLDQLIHLRTYGCKEAQGYFFSRPVPADAATTLLQRMDLTPT